MSPFRSRIGNFHGCSKKFALNTEVPLLHIGERLAHHRGTDALPLQYALERGTVPLALRSAELTTASLPLSGKPVACASGLSASSSQTLWRSYRSVYGPGRSQRRPMFSVSLGVTWKVSAK